jgi:glycosyltransferase involved in cell wall biosynthesis
MGTVNPLHIALNFYLWDKLLNMAQRFSIIIPVYNRPQEVEELLESLTNSDEKPLEIIIVEDGSSISCREVVDKYNDLLPLKYLQQSNSGPGPARNFGAQAAKGEYLIFLDSDCLVPPTYLTILKSALTKTQTDCFGGPDRTHQSFSTIQKAIGYSMTSPLTTGGIRGEKKKMDKFYPRSFNLGIKKSVFEAVNGFAPMRFGEDLDLSMRIIEAGYKTCLIHEAFVYHKRRNTFKSFYKQVYNSGIARINLHLNHPGTLKIVHALPSLFVMGHVVAGGLIILFSGIAPMIFTLLMLPPLLLFVDAWMRCRNFATAIFAVPASYTQLSGYGIGFLSAFWKRIILKQGEFQRFKNSFYK